MMIRPILLSAMETALSRWIALDPESPRLLKPIIGKVIALRASIPRWTFYLCPTDSQVQVLEHFEGTPDATLVGSPLAFASAGFTDNPVGILFSGQLAIEGDSKVAQNFQMLFRNLDIDWEEQLARITGDILAHRVGNVARATRQWGQESINSLQQNVGEYLQEERGDLPTAYECNEWMQEVDTLRADIDRLEVRIKSLPESPD